MALTEAEAQQKFLEREERVIDRYLTNPCVLVLREKHGTVYMDALTKESLYASALSVLAARRKAGYWYYEPDLPKEKPSLSNEQRLALPEGPVRKAADDEFRRYKREMDYYREQLDFIHNVDEAIKNNSGLLAYILLKDRGDGEYEGIQLEPISRNYG